MIAVLLLLVAVLLDLLLTWLILRMIGQARQYRSLTAVMNRDTDDGAWPSVALIVPARDEAASIATCVRGLLVQDYPTERFSVHVVDDDSRDGTAFLATDAAAGNARVRVISAGSVLPGWTGKSHAIAVGIDDRLRGGAPPDYLCFVDADTVAEPGLLRAAVTYARDAGIDMLSLGPRQELGGWAERLVMPCGFYLVAAARDLGRINAPDSPEAAANGQFLLFRATAYDQLGGHAAVRAEICEDTALARRSKRFGLRFELLGTETLIRTRMYRSAAALWTGLSKNVTELGGGVDRTVLIAAAGATLALLVPALTGICLVAWERQPTFQTAAAAGLTSAGFLTLVGLHLAGARHFRIPLFYSLLFPFGYGLCLALALNGARLARHGEVRWKGRTYSSVPASAVPPIRATTEPGDADA